MCLMIACEYGNVNDVIFFLKKMSNNKKLNEKTINNVYCKAIEFNHLPIVKKISSMYKIDETLEIRGVYTAIENGRMNFIVYFESIGVDLLHKNGAFLSKAKEYNQQTIYDYIQRKYTI